MHKVTACPTSYKMDLADSSSSPPFLRTQHAFINQLNANTLACYSRLAELYEAEGPNFSCPFYGEVFAYIGENYEQAVDTKTEKCRACFAEFQQRSSQLAQEGYPFSDCFQLVRELFNLPFGNASIVSTFLTDSNGDEMYSIPSFSFFCTLPLEVPDLSNFCFVSPIGLSFEQISYDFSPKDPDDSTKSVFFLRKFSGHDYAHSALLRTALTQYLQTVFNERQSIEDVQAEFADSQRNSEKIRNHQATCEDEFLVRALDLLLFMIEHEPIISWAPILSSRNIQLLFNKSTPANFSFSHVLEALFSKFSAEFCFEECYLDREVHKKLPKACYVLASIGGVPLQHCEAQVAKAIENSKWASERLPMSFDHPQLSGEALVAFWRAKLGPPQMGPD